MHETPDHPFFEETPKNFFSGGPYLSVALPESIQSVVPVNATSLVREWESMLDPIEALRQVAEAALREDWLVDKWYTLPDWNTVERLKEASRDEGLIALFARLFPGSLSWAATEGDDHQGSVSDLLSEFGDGAILNNYAEPVLLGLAVASALEYRIGQASVSLWPRIEAARKEREEKERDEKERKEREREEREREE